ncbi:glycogen synthase [Kitasatospora sp. McL0602]|uniref:glycogen synthase n=1 Tax=Kitasatospora sp. McL0602 TaxID=3439530 RepID=UPI003F89704C
MRVELLTRDYPSEAQIDTSGPTIELTAALRRHVKVGVRCFGEGSAEPDTYAYKGPESLGQGYSALQFLGAGLGMADDCFAADLVHSHTWYTSTAGHVAGRLYGIPHVMTLSDLEPLRPGEAERPGSDHALSGWMERASAHEADAVITGSAAMREDVLSVYPDVSPDRTHVIHPGIDTELWRPDHGTAALERFGIDPDRPFVLFAGRATQRQGLPHLLRAAFRFRPDAQLVLCCDQPENPGVRREVDFLVDELSHQRSGVVRIEGMPEQPDMRQLLAQARAFVCPSLRDPIGTVNLKAMACGTAVVATAVGGIPEIVEDGNTGLLVRYEQRADGSGDPVDPERLAQELALSVNALIDDPVLAEQFGAAGRQRASEEYSWDEVAARTLSVYQQLTTER